MNNVISRPMRGIVPPMITPLLSPDTLDTAGLERLIEHLVAGGVHGIFVLGTTGEGPSLSYRLRRELIQRVVSQVNGRIPVLVGVTDTAYLETRKMAEFAAETGGSAIVLAPPYYFYTSQADLLRLVEGLAKDCSLPLFLYNMPSMTKMVFEPETVAQAAGIPNVYGLKDSSGDRAYLNSVVAAVKNYKDFTLFVGPQELLVDAMRLGVHGGVLGAANICPKLYVDLYEACVQGRKTDIDDLQMVAESLAQALFGFEDAEYRYIRGLKCALSIMGICSDLPAWPYQAAGQNVRDAIEAHLNSSFSLRYRS
jgi:dihydrodipicolinate synthase/N-acetylneuraminate lyase